LLHFCLFCGSKLGKKTKTTSLQRLRVRIS
jgi:hypothetical protein